MNCKMFLLPCDIIDPSAGTMETYLFPPLLLFLLLSKLGLLVHHHTSDRHVRVLLFGFLYGLGQCLMRPPPHPTRTDRK